MCVESRNGGKGEGTTQGTDAHIHIGVSPFHSYHNFSHNQERDREGRGGAGGKGRGGARKREKGSSVRDSGGVRLFAVVSAKEFELRVARVVSDVHARAEKLYFRRWQGHVVCRNSVSREIVTFRCTCPDVTVRVFARGGGVKRDHRDRYSSMW